MIAEEPLQIVETQRTQPAGQLNAARPATEGGRVPAFRILTSRASAQ